MFKKRRDKHTSIVLSGTEIEVTRKKVKNLNIRVYPSTGEVKISAPIRASQKVIEDFARSRLQWIHRHLSNGGSKKTPLKEQTYISGEHHPVWGEDYELNLIIQKAKPKIEADQEAKKLRLYVRSGTESPKRAKVLKEWYRAELKREIPKLIKKWELPMGVNVKEFGVKQMKTRWGTCNIRDRRIWLNLELAKKSPDCLEYVVVHEMVHLLERLHNKRFYGFMDQFLPGWKETKNKLNGRVD